MKVLRKAFWVLGLLAALGGCGGSGAPGSEASPSAVERSSWVGTVEPDSQQAGAASARPSVAPVESSVRRKSDPVGQAVYRFSSLGTGAHFYTMSVSERDLLVSKPSAFRYEGTAFLAMSAVDTPYLPVYRFQNKVTGTHFYTASEAEKSSIQANLTHIYQFEGVAWRAKGQSAAGWVPMRRFHVSHTGVHFYTANATEYANLLQQAGFKYEGVAYYVQPVGAGGSIDPSFGTEGKLLGSRVSTDMAAAGSARLSDGRLLTGGLCRIGDAYQFCVGRFLANGSLDQTFGSGGWAALQVSTFRAGAEALSVLPDGRIVVGGSCADLYDLGNYFCMVRFTPEGAVDTGFGLNGLSRFHASSLPFGGVGDVLTDIVVSGEATLFVTGECAGRFCVAKVLDNGSLDATYGAQGVATASGTGVIEIASVLRLDSQGRVVVGGTCRQSSDAFKFCLMRFDTAGALDATFGTGGAVRHTVGFSMESEVKSLLPVSGGGWLAVGTCNMGAVSGYDFCAVRYSEDGVRSPDYGGFGYSMQAVTAAQGADLAKAATLDADGRLAIVGACSAGSATSQFCGVRLLANGMLDTSFASGGRVLINMPGRQDIPRSVVVDPDGRWVLGGQCSTSETSDVAFNAFCMARYLP